MTDLTWQERRPDFTVLMGQVLTKCHQNGDDEIIFETEGGKKYRLYHSQDCCESVYIEDICGDLHDLLGSPIIEAEEATNYNEPPVKEYEPESYTWTFYKIGTARGNVTIRFFGESNGYYSETADFERIA